MARKSHSKASGPSVTLTKSVPSKNGKPEASFPLIKSAHEQELDRLVWGDEPGFRSALQEYTAEDGLMGLRQEGDVSDADKEEPVQDPAGLEDSDVSDV